MTTPDDEPAVSYQELADLQAELLSAEEEAELRMRMARDPDVRAKLADLRTVDQLLGYSPVEADPPDMPADVAARIQARLAEEARRRAQGEPSSDPDVPPPPTEGDLTDIEDDRSGPAR